MPTEYQRRVADEIVDVLNRREVTRSGDAPYWIFEFDETIFTQPDEH